MFNILPKHINFYNKNGYLVCRGLFNKKGKNYKYLI